MGLTTGFWGVQGETVANPINVVIGFNNKVLGCSGETVANPIKVDFVMVSLMQFFTFQAAPQLWFYNQVIPYHSALVKLFG